ncbi:GOLD domain-containing protein [Paramicrosporidium saccamoebae]|uniref:GOLD domain-containing protein n=1 Tax=Paramicrosporidium saccamoebae TaxID=1246581 RepID=A0A2H9TFK6_9FUNG|nr:GOLD domain-containing protein [Paramicrosporidium saccamoebae]
MRAFTTAAILLASSTLVLAEDRPLNYRVEATAEHYGSRGVCVGYDVPGGSLAAGYFHIRNPHPSVRTSVLIYEGGNQPFSQQELSGEARFSFRSRAEGGRYEACVRALPKSTGSLPAGTNVDVSLLFKWKFDLFDDETAKRVMLQPIEGEFYQLEESINRLGKELNEFVLNEEKLRDTNESTLDRLRGFAFLSVIVLVGLGVYQIFYLKQFFKTKKLI